MSTFNVCLTLGRLWGRLGLKHLLAHFRRRAQQFDLTVIGEEHLHELRGRAHLIVSNHIRPHDSLLGPLANLRFVRQYQFSADSFLFHRAMWERASRLPTIVAQCDRGELSPRPWRRTLQQRIGQPFAIGQLEALPGYIPVESRPGASHRRFLAAIGQAAHRQEAILIFPGPIHLDDGRPQPRLELGSAHIARKFDLPILPACIMGSESWRPGQVVTVMFGKPFSAAELTKVQINEEIIRRVRALHDSYAIPTVSSQTRRATLVPDRAHKGSPPPGWVLPPTK